MIKDVFLLNFFRAISVFVISRFHLFCSGQLSRKHLRIVDQYRKMLRADPNVLLLIFKIDERDLFLSLFADETMGDYC